MQSNQQNPHIPGVGAPIPPTDPARAATYAHPRPGMQTAPTAPPGYRLVADHQPVMAAAPPPPPWAVSPDGGPPVRGTRVYFDVGPGFEARGVKYGFRHLGIRDANKMYGLLEEMIGWGLHNGVLKFGPFVKALREGRAADKLLKGAEAGDGGETWLLAMVAPFLGIRVVEDDLIALLESIILGPDGALIQEKSLSDPELFPMGCLPNIITALGAHPDFASFFGSCGEAMTHPTAVAAMDYLMRRAHSMMPEVSPTSTAGSE